MNIIYTYWSNGGNNVSCGFGMPQLFFQAAQKSLVLASRQQYVNNIIVYTDLEGADILKHNITPINKVSIVIIDYSKFVFDKRYWNFPKLISYALQKDIFLHIDFDVFLKPNFTEQIDFSTDIIAEMLRDYHYENEFNKFNENKKIPKSLICSGLIGGANLQIFKDNFELAKKACIPTKEEITFWDLVGIEEFSLTKLAIARNLSVQELESDSFVHFGGRCKYSRWGEEIKNYKI